MLIYTDTVYTDPIKDVEELDKVFKGYSGVHLRVEDIEGKLVAEAIMPRSQALNYLEKGYAVMMPDYPLRPNVIGAYEDAALDLFAQEVIALYKGINDAYNKAPLGSGLVHLMAGSAEAQDAQFRELLKNLKKKLVITARKK